ncbi:MAG TPA: hypothetical protein VEI94_02690 [Candidatus Bathyarchaeia archaeon]|nr:hypothetical protein [Candidatus Bathyarchaeia archaeon]
MGARIRGQWRYLVRSTDDPFVSLASRESLGATNVKRRLSADRAAAR